MCEESVMLCVKQLYNPSSNEYKESTRMRKEMIKQKENAFAFIKMIVDKKYDNVTVVFVLDMIMEMIDYYNTELPLYEIVNSFVVLIDSFFEENSILSKIGEIIALSTRLIYQREERFLFFIEETKDTITDMETSVYTHIMNKFDVFRNDCSKSKNITINNFMKKNVIPQYFRLGVRTICHSPKQSLQILIGCYSFHTNFNLSFPLNYDYEMIHPIANSIVFNELFTLATSLDNSISHNAVYLIAIISKTIYCRTNPEIATLVQKFTTDLLNSPSFFESSNNISSFCTLLNMIDPLCPEAPFHGLFRELLNFLVRELKNDFVRTMSFLHPALELYFRYPMAARDPLLIEMFSEMLLHFIFCCIDSFETQPQQTYEAIFFDQKSSAACIRILWIHSNIKSNDVASFISTKLGEIQEQAFSISINYQIGFLLLVIKVALKNPSVFDNNMRHVKNENETSCLVSLVDSAFLLMTNTNECVKELHDHFFNDGIVFQMEISLISFLKCFTVFFWKPAQTQSSQIQLTCFENVVEMAEAVFLRIWNDLRMGICYENARKTIKDIVDQKNMFTVLGSSSISSVFLEEYHSYPSLSVVFFVIAKFMLSNDEFKAKYLESISRTFSIETNMDNVLQLFKILSGLFQASSTQPEWCELYTFFYDNFAEICNVFSNSSSGKTLLKFIRKLIAKSPQSNPFKSHTPHSFRLFRFLIQLIIQLTSTLLQSLDLLNVDDSVFDSAFVFVDDIESEPIGLCEARDIGLDKRQMRLRSTNLRNDVCPENDNWSLIPIILESVNGLLKSPFPNFGIIQYYDDRTVFDFFCILLHSMNCNGPRGVVSLLSMPELVLELSFFLMYSLPYYGYLYRESQESYLFIIKFTKVAFLSHINDVIRNNCIALLYLLRFIETARELDDFKQQFVLALNVAIYHKKNKFTSAVDFVSEYVRLDVSFPNEIVDEVVNGLESKEAKTQIRDSFTKLFSNLPSNENVSEFHNQFSTNFEEFQDEISAYSIKIHENPALSSYFSFF